MRFTRKKPNRGDVGVVITSLLDVNFLLIMFFLMTAQFQRETHALLNLPQERGEEELRADEASLVININAAGEVIVANAVVDLQELRTMVREQVSRSSPGSLKLMVRADRHANSQDLNRVVSLLRETGVGAVRIATEVPR
jgi:biopolymer transport protein ExbD